VRFGFGSGMISRIAGKSTQSKLTIISALHLP